MTKIVASELITPPVAEPVELAEVKAHLNILHATEDAKVARFARAARAHAEKDLSRALISQTWRVYLKTWPSDGVIPLDMPPLVSVTAVKYLDADGAEQTLASSAYHVIKHYFTPRIERKSGVTWPATAIHPQAVWVDYVCGYGASPANVPEDIRNGILMLAEHLYFNRGATSEVNVVKTPIAVDALFGPHKTHGWI
jgi:uncharacterized phiE125 gp8 family phage protein